MTGVDDCPFCPIVRGDDESARVICRTPMWIAFFPLNPATKGHTLVVPVEHVENYWQLRAELAAQLAEGALLVGRALERVVKPGGMNLITSAGQAAEQTVGHVHLHLVPRWSDDRVGPIWPPDKETPSATLDLLADGLRAACR